jgi:tRNA (guanine37-N1)-methyltransferase
MFVPLKTSILKRANIEVINFREYSKDKHKKVDDTVYGGGAGMLLSCQPIYDCLQNIDKEHKAYRIFMTPFAPVLSQIKAKELSKKEEIIILCGHYEGVDQRVIDMCFDECISIGNFVLTGGELPAMVLVDCVSRFTGIIKDESLNDDGHPQYTKPDNFMGVKVPDVLLSGNHANIKKFNVETKK